jgi:hypothetical protein
MTPALWIAGLWGQVSVHLLCHGRMPWVAAHDCCRVSGKRRSKGESPCQSDLCGNLDLEQLTRRRSNGIAQFRNMN